MVSPRFFHIVLKSFGSKVPPPQVYNNGWNTKIKKKKKSEVKQPRFFDD